MRIERIIAVLLLLFAVPLGAATEVPRLLAQLDTFDIWVNVRGDLDQDAANLIEAQFKERIAEQLRSAGLQTAGEDSLPQIEVEIRFQSLPAASSQSAVSLTLRVVNEVISREAPTVGGVAAIWYANDFLSVTDDSLQTDLAEALDHWIEHLIFLVDRATNSGEVTADTPPPCRP